MTSRIAWGGLLAVTLSGLGCGNGLVAAAERGDRGAVSRGIAEAHARGELSDRRAADLGLAVARRELEIARGRDAVERLEDLSPCAAELDGTLAALAERRDEAGARAAMLRVESGAMSRAAAREWLGDGDDAWRAVAVRALTGPDDGPMRREALLAGSPEIRRAAVAASREAADRADLDALFEAARVDPDLLTRSQALRAIGEIARRTTGHARESVGRSVAMRLRDLWSAGDDALRQDVAVGWVLSPTYEQGGREALGVYLGNPSATGRIAVAAAVLRNARDGSADREVAAAAEALLVRVLGEGSVRDRLHALAASPLTATLGREIAKLAASPAEPEVRVAAWSRLLESEPYRAQASRELVRHASVAAGDLGRRARHALASQRWLPVQAWIERDLRAPRALDRLAAAHALAELGRAARAAPLLVDDDASVRARVACVLVAAGRR